MNFQCVWFCGFYFLSKPVLYIFLCTIYWPDVLDLYILNIFSVHNSLGSLLYRPCNISGLEPTGSPVTGGPSIWMSALAHFKTLLPHMTDCMNLGPRIVTLSFKPVLNPKTASCALFWIAETMRSTSRWRCEGSKKTPLCSSKVNGELPLGCPRIHQIKTEPKPRIFFNEH